jgi:hypothetical protein
MDNARSAARSAEPKSRRPGRGRTGQGAGGNLGSSRRPAVGGGVRACGTVLGGGLQHGGLQCAVRDWGRPSSCAAVYAGADCSARRRAEAREWWPDNVWRRVRHLGLGGGGSCLAVFL